MSVTMTSVTLDSAMVMGKEHYVITKYTFFFCMLDDVVIVLVHFFFNIISHHLTKELPSELFVLGAGFSCKSYSKLHKDFPKFQSAMANDDEDTCELNYILWFSFKFYDVYIAFVLFCIICNIS